MLSREAANTNFIVFDPIPKSSALNDHIATILFLIIERKTVKENYSKNLEVNKNCSVHK
jgi:hypothetical protein